MKKRLLIGFLIMSVTLLSSCINLSNKPPKEYDPHNYEHDREIVYNQKTMKEILRCFDEGDVQGIKSMFSPDIQSKYDLESQIEKAFSLYEGKSLSYGEIRDHGIVTAYTEDGYYTRKRIGAKMKGITTDTDKIYVIDFEKYVLYDEDEDKLGLYKVSLRTDNTAEGNETTIAVIGSNKMEE